MHKSGIAIVSAVLAAGTISIPFAASAATGTSVSVLATTAIGHRLAEWKGSDTRASDQFGTSVAISGTTAIVGAWGHAHDAGRAYVFTRTASGWKQTAEIKGSDTVVGDIFGGSVAISGTSAIIGAPSHANSSGRAYVFTKTASGWSQTAELKGSDTTSLDTFGTAVAMSGTTAIVGAPAHASFAGRAYVFTKTASGWSQTAEIKGSDTSACGCAPDPSDEFGYSVAISGTNLVVGAWGHAHQSGRAYVFAQTASGWKQTAELKGADTRANDQVGISVAISGTTVVVGADSHATDAGRAYVFVRTAKGWKQAGELKGSDTVPGDIFGTAVAISGTTVVVGAQWHAKDAGRAYVFIKTTKGWKQAGELKGSDTVGDGLGFGRGGDEFGGSVAVSGATAVVGASGHAHNAGRAYLFKA